MSLESVENDSLWKRVLFSKCCVTQVQDSRI